jgi:hypothetical protein
VDDETQLRNVLRYIQGTALIHLWVPAIDTTLAYVRLKPSPEALVRWKLLRDKESAIAVLRSALGERA